MVRAFAQWAMGRCIDSSQNMNYKSINSFYIFVISEIGNWGDKTPDAPIRKHPGDYAKLTCKNAPESAPPGVFKWYLGDKGDTITDI